MFVLRSFIVTNIVVVYILHTNQSQIHIPHTMRNPPGPRSTDLRRFVPHVGRVRVLAVVLRPGTCQVSASSRALRGPQLDGWREPVRRMRSGALRESRGTPEDVEEHHEKMWEDKATDAD